MNEEEAKKHIEEGLRVVSKTLADNQGSIKRHFALLCAMNRVSDAVRVNLVENGAVTHDEARMIQRLSDECVDLQVVAFNDPDEARKATATLREELVEFGGDRTTDENRYVAHEVFNDLKPQITEQIEVEIDRYAKMIEKHSVEHHWVRAIVTTVMWGEFVNRIVEHSDSPLDIRKVTDALQDQVSAVARDLPQKEVKDDEDR